ncbi:MAG: DUF5123 domain-containing protein, partial [Acidobacteriaceae bacterium]|nr:DUF5123 domain-containing protein [Acidobacteriaceae bacterium]
SEPIKQQPVGHWQQFPPMITAKGNYLIFDALDIDGDDDATNAKAIGGCITNGGSHHLVVENSVVHGCGSAGIAANSDYMWIINNLVYDNAHYDTYFEGSGIDSYEPRAANIHHPEFVPNENDKALKYHTTIAFNVVHDNYIGKECHPSFPPNPQGCGTNGGDGHTDGNGIMLDDWQHTQGDNKPYTGGALVLGNIVYNNGAGGLVIFQTANVMAVNNTSYNNFTDPLNSGDHRGDISCSICFNTQFINNASHAVVGSAPPYSFNSGYACEPESKDVTFTTNIGHEKSIRCTFSGTGNLFNADPQFVDPGKGNFNLTPGSPAMRSGTRQPWLKPSRPNRGQVQGVRRRSRSNGQ